MEKAMQPFIFIYHFVRGVFRLPKTILDYSYTGFIAVIDKVTRGNRNKKRLNNKQEISNEEEALENIIPKEITSINQNQIRETQGNPISFRYEVKTSAGQTIKSVFEAYSKDEVYNFLTNEGYQVIKIEPRKPYDIDLFTGGKMKAGDLSFALTQLSTYIKAGIPLIDSVRILAKQSTMPERRKIYE